MKAYQELTKEELLTLKAELNAAYEDAKGKGLKLDMSRGKPAVNQLDMRAFHFVIHCLTDIMQQTCTFCKTDIQSQLCSKQTGQMRYLDRMLQCVLTVARPEFHLT